MNKNDIIYERNVLYSVSDENEIGAVCVRLIGGTKGDKIVAIVEPKSDHNPWDYVKMVLQSIDSEVFKRAKISITDNVDIILLNNENGMRIVFEKDDSKENYHLEEISRDEFELLK